MSPKLKTLKTLKTDAKRKFEKTKEPAGEGGVEGEVSAEFCAQVAKKYKVPAERPIYVVHEHAARRLHWDLRLELEGVLKSWALPKGIPTKKGEKHLAVQTEDHPLEYASFSGEIPAGNYGAGTVKIWDRGTFELWKREAGMIKVWLMGKKIKGEYVLVKMAPRPAFPGKNSWLLFKRLDWEERQQEIKRLAEKRKITPRELLASFKTQKLEAK